MAGTVVEALAPGYAYSLDYERRLIDRQTAFQHLEVLQTRRFGIVLRLDGSLQCSEKDEFFYHEPLVHMAAFSHPSPRSVLIIGGGDGGSAEEVLKHPTVEDVVMVELDAAVVEAAVEHLGSVHRGVLNGADGRLAVVIEDGMNYLVRCRRAFDLILLDLTDPGTVSSPLYRSDFYRLCAGHLTKQGIMTLHVASPWAQEGRVREAFGALREAGFETYPFLTSIPMSGGAWLMALCRMPSPLGLSLYRRRLQGPKLGYYSPEMHKAMFVQPPYLKALLDDSAPESGEKAGSAA